MIKAQLYQLTKHRCSYGKKNKYLPLRTSGPPCGFFVLYFSVLYFLCCIFLCYIFLYCIKITSLSVTNYYVICSADSFVKALNKRGFLEVGKPELIHYLVICLCLFQNYLSVIKLNCLMLLLLILLIFGLH